MAISTGMTRSELHGFAFWTGTGICLACRRRTPMTMRVHSLSLVLVVGRRGRSAVMESWFRESWFSDTKELTGRTAEVFAYSICGAAFKTQRDK